MPVGSRLAEADAAVGCDGVAHVLVDHLAVEPFRIEVAAGPAFGFAVVGMLGVGDDLEEIGIAADTTDILGWAGTSTVDAAGRARRRVESEEPLDVDDVLPVITKVIEVDKPQAFGAGEVEQAHGVLVEAAGIAPELGLADLVRIAVGQSADLELVQVVVPPPERGLEDAMELAEMEATRDDKTAPYRGLDRGKCDADLESVGFLEAHGEVCRRLA